MLNRLFDDYPNTLPRCFKHLNDYVGAVLTLKTGEHTVIQMFVCVWTLADPNH